jgi:heat shock protein HslJ
MKTQKPFFTEVILLIVILMAACTAGSGNDPLAETSWKLVSINGVPVLKGTEPSVGFSDGKISGSSGCNTFGGSYKISGQKITTSSIAMTLMACADPGAMDQEQAFLGYLQDSPSFKLTAGQLQIIRSDGKALIFTQQ